MLYANWPVTCEDHRTWDSDEGEGRVAAVDKKLVCEGVGHGQHEDDCFETFATTPVAARVRLLVGRALPSCKTGDLIVMVSVTESIVSRLFPQHLLRLAFVCW